MKNKKIRLQDALFYIGFTLFMISNFLRNTEIDINTDLLWFTTLMILIIKIIFTRYKKKELLLFCGLIILFIIPAYKSRNYYLMSVPIAIIACKNMPFKNIIKIVFYTNLIMTIITILLAVFFSVGQISQTRVFRSDGAIITRYYLGFIHPNQLAITIFSILASSILIYWNKIDVKFYIVYGILICVFNYLLDSNTSFYLSIILLVFTYLLKKIENKKIKLDYNFFWCGTILIILLAILGMINYGKIELIQKIDKLLSTRIYTSYRMYTRNGITFFGNDIFKDFNVTFDQGINYILIRYGLVLFITTIIVLLKSFKKLSIENTYKYQLILILFVLYSFVENVVFDVYRNIGIYIIYYALIELNNIEVKKDYEERK